MSQLALATAVAAEYAQAARADKTRTAYTSQLRQFSAWCQARDLQALPAAPQTVAIYAADRARSGRKVATISQAMAAISQAHQVSGLESPTRHPAVREVLSGIRRTHCVAPVRKAAISTEQLAQMVDGCSARDRALLLVGWAGAFRRSELVGLDVSDLAFDDAGVTIHLRRSKTDQTGKGQSVSIPRAKSALCPVAALGAVLPAAGKVFPLQPREVARIVQRAARRAGIVADVAGHSLRAGYVTSAAKAGMPMHIIQRQTRHASLAVLSGYIRDAEKYQGGLL